MKLSGIGEKKALEELAELLETGDDCGYMKFGRSYLLVTTDMLYMGVHLHEKMTWRERANKTVAVNFSDISAMGGTPIAFVMSFGTPDMDFGDFKTFSIAVDACCKKYGAKFLGGDLICTDKLTISGTAIGIADRPVLRSGAREGDLVCVTGTLGAAGVGFDMHTRKVKVKNKKAYENALKRCFEPEPKIKEGVLLMECASAMTDVSDGLITDSYNIANASSLGIEIDIKNLPIDECVLDLCKELGYDPLEYALYAGEDYELLFTIPEKEWKKIKGRIEASTIGRVIEGNGVFTVRGSKKTKEKRKLYDHFHKRIM